MSVGTLFISRHAESEWNALGKWTGTTDVHLTENGFSQAGQLGVALKGIKLDEAFCSQQIRTKETLEGILDGSENFAIPITRSVDLNERDYGDYTGMNKWEVRDKVGEEEFNSIRRDWDHPVPNGETLKVVYERAIPYFLNVILPKLLAGENVIIVAHGNSIRALIKYIEDISDEGVASVEMPFGTIITYVLDDAGKKQKREDITIEVTKPSNA
jgi:2,3-bisphosphoglycerate-dependent phosphoglycerate mutase